jgi:hypothetical protein
MFFLVFKLWFFLSKWWSHHQTDETDHSSPRTHQAAGFGHLIAASNRKLGACDMWSMENIMETHTYIYIYLYRSMYTFVHMYMYLYMFMDMHIACASILSTGGTSQPTIQGNTQTNVVTNQQCNGNTNLEDMIWGHNTDCKRITIRGIATNMLEARLRWNGQLLEGCILMLSILCHSRITSVFLVNKKDTAKTATQWVWQLSVWSQYRDNRFWSFVYYGNSIMRDLTDLTNKSAEWQFTNVK